MNLVAIAAFIAVASAAKLDRTYLPPASAKTAGGSPGSLQTPFAAESFNNGLGGLPTGSYTNDFQGVVVDAASAGTRTAEDGASGLGAPRISYGSTDSKVGAAAFKVNQAGFRQPSDEAQAGLDGQTAGTKVSQGFQSPSFSNSERPRAALDRAANTLRFESEVGQESYNYAFETDNGIAAEENGVATNGVQAQGGFSYTGDDGQVYSVTYTADEGGYQPKGDHLPTPPPIPEDILKSLEKNARDEAAGLVDDGSYDAQKYNAGSDYAESDSSNGNFNHQSSSFGHGAEADATASGTFINQNNQPFRGSNAGQNGFASQSSSNGVKGQPNYSTSGFSGSGQSTSIGQFGSNSGLSEQGANDGGAGQGNSASDFAGQFGQTASQSGAGQNNYEITGQFGNAASSRPKGPSVQRRPGKNENGASNSLAGNIGSVNSQSNNAFKPSSNGFNSFAQGQQSSNGNAFGNNNEYLPPVTSFNQNKRPGARPFSKDKTSLYYSNENSSSEESSEEHSKESSEEHSKESSEGSGETIPGKPIPLSQQNVEKRPQESVSSSFGQPTSFGISGRPGKPGQLEQPTKPGRPGFGFSGAQTFGNNIKPASNSNSFAQGTQSSQATNGLGHNEYLPPVPGFNQNRRPNQNRLQGTNSSPQFNQQYNSNTQASGNFLSQRPGSEAQSSQFIVFQKPQATVNENTNYQNGNSRFPSQANGQLQFTAAATGAQNGAPGQFSSQSAQATFASFGTQQPTLQPATELVTPLESDNINDSQSSSQTTSSNFNLGSSDGRPGQTQFASKLNGQNASPVPTSSSAFPSFGSKPALAANPQRPTQSFGSKQTLTPAFPTQSSQSQFNQASQFSTRQPDSSQSFAPNDVQYSPSTQRPSYNKQAQGPDDSYYYNQPSKAFGTPQETRFPNAPSNQFNRVTQRPSFSQNNGQLSNSQNVQSTSFSQNGQPQGSSNYPRPPTLAPPRTQIQNGQPQGSANYPKPPTLAPVTGITQASISPFPSEAPTQATQSSSQGQFGSRPNFQQSNQFNQAQTIQSSKPAFGQMSSFSQQTTVASQSFQQRPHKPSFLNQQNYEQSLNQDQSESPEDTAQVPIQQYNGEIYEYNKPAQPLPAPSDKEGTPGSGQFGQRVQGQFGQTKPQFGQKEDSKDDQSATTPQLGFQKTDQSQPQFGSQPRPQFNQNAQGSFGAQSSNSQGSRPQYDVQSRPQFSQMQETNKFGSQSQGQSSQFSQPSSTFTDDSDSQGPQINQDTKPQLGNTIRPSCCQTSSQFGSVKPAQGFGVQSSFSGAQNSKPNAAISSFAGKGEVFEGQRKPPSFDENTGYHY